MAGELPLLSLTTRAITDGSGTHTKYTTYPDDGTRIETYLQDGSLYEVTGTAVHAVGYEYGITNDLDSIWRAYTKINDLGELEYTILDVDRDGSPDQGGPDRGTRTVKDYIHNHDQDVIRTRTFTCNDGRTNQVLLATSEISTNGLESWQTLQRDENNAATTRTVTVCDPNNRARTVTVLHPDLNSTLSFYQDARLMSVTHKKTSGTNLTQNSYVYDPQGRLYSAPHLNNHTTIYTNNNADQVISITSPANQTTLTGYDNLGRVHLITNADNSVLTQEYWQTGELKSVSGAGTYSAGYGYDGRGRLKYLTNWQESATIVTTWNYSSDRGLLTSKVYEDDQGPSYTYAAAGRLASRVWARGVTNTYTYNNAGDLASITYSDGTPAVAFTYNRQGRLASATVAGTNETALIYNDAGQLLSESHSGGLLSGLTVTNVYDSYLRRSNLNGTHATTNLLSQSFGYDAVTGRLKTVTDGANSAGYSYLANSPLVEYIYHTNAGALRMTTQKAYDSVNRLTSIANSTNSTAVSSRAYQYSSVNLRTAITHEDSSYWTNGYNAQFEVTASKRHWSDNTPAAGQQYTFAYDGIGNRQTSREGGNKLGGGLRESVYTANALNQYTQRLNPGAYDVIGKATNTATVTLNYRRAERHGDYFHLVATSDNESSPIYVEANIVCQRRRENGGKPPV